MCNSNILFWKNWMSPKYRRFVLPCCLTVEYLQERSAMKKTPVRSSLVAVSSALFLSFQIRLNTRTGMAFSCFVGGSTIW